MSKRIEINDLEFVFHKNYGDSKEDEIVIGVKSSALDCNMAMILKIGEEAAQKIKSAFHNLEEVAPYEFYSLKNKGE